MEETLEQTIEKVNKVSEHDLCNRLITAFDGTEFRVFAEYENWDLVVTRGKVILGIQAKLTLNVKAIAQTIRGVGVHFKAILVNNYKTRLNDPYLTILTELKILLINCQFINGQYKFSLVNDYRHAYNLQWLYKWRHHPGVPLTIPDFDYTTRAGVASPNRVTENNINLVKLEKFALTQPLHRVTLAQVRDFGFYRVPRRYFFYEWDSRMWQLDEMYSASKDYPHIAAGIEESQKNV